MKKRKDLERIFHFQTPFSPILNAHSLFLFSYCFIPNIMFKIPLKIDLLGLFFLRLLLHGMTHYWFCFGQDQRRTAIHCCQSASRFAVVNHTVTVEASYDSPSTVPELIPIQLPELSWFAPNAETEVIRLGFSQKQSLVD